MEVAISGLGSRVSYRVFLLPWGSSLVCCCFFVLVSFTGAPRNKVFLLHSERGIVKGLGLGVGGQGIDTDGRDICAKVSTP